MRVLSVWMVVLVALSSAAPFVCGAAVSQRLQAVFSSNATGGRMLVARIVPREPVAGAVVCGEVACDAPFLAVRGTYCDLDCSTAYATSDLCDGTQVEFKTPGRLVSAHGRRGHQTYRYDSDGDCDADRRVEVSRRGSAVTVRYRR